MTSLMLDAQSNSFAVQEVLFFHLLAFKDRLNARNKIVDVYL